MYFVRAEIWRVIVRSVRLLKANDKLIIGGFWGSLYQLTPYFQCFVATARDTVTTFKKINWGDAVMTTAIKDLDQ